MLHSTFDLLLFNKKSYCRWLVSKFIFVVYRYLHLGRDEAISVTGIFYGYLSTCGKI